MTTENTTSGENKIFESKYTPSGCVFFPAGMLLAGLMLIILMASVDQAAAGQFHWQAIPLFFILGCLAYFCFSRALSGTMISLGIYPTHITINNKQFPWEDIAHITFQTEEMLGGPKKAIRINLNKEKYKKSDRKIAILLLVVCASTLLALLLTPKVAVSGLSIAVLFALFPAMFGVSFTNPGSKAAPIDPKDLETVLQVAQYYADLHNIPCEQKR